MFAICGFARSGTMVAWLFSAQRTTRAAEKAACRGARVAKTLPAVAARREGELDLAALAPIWHYSGKLVARVRLADEPYGFVPVLDVIIRGGTICRGCGRRNLIPRAQGWSPAESVTDLSARPVASCGMFSRATTGGTATIHRIRCFFMTDTALLRILRAWPRGILDDPPAVVTGYCATGSKGVSYNRAELMN